MRPARSSARRSRPERAITVRPQTFEEHGDEIVVSGSVRLQRPAGGFAESQIRWIYRFREGLIEDAQWGPRHPD